jgi:hypothetical protein
VSRVGFSCLILRFVPTAALLQCMKNRCRYIATMARAGERIVSKDRRRVQARPQSDGDVLPLKWGRQA